MIESQKSLSVFTPTYNRAYTLHKCYESLKRQTNKDFLWIIVDDGSTDNTEELVNGWKIEKSIEIKYIKQINGGKQRAHNTGVLACNTELFICVDSDDFLTDDAIGKLLDAWDNISDKKEIAGIIALKINITGTPLSTALPKGIISSPLEDLYEINGFKGDTALLYRTDLLKTYPFIIFEGEKFMGEEYVYRQIDQNYNMMLLNEAICICEYMEDGYSTNYINLIKSNPKGYILLKKQAALLTKSYKYKIKHTICYIVGCYIDGEKHFIKNSKNKMICLLVWLPAVIAYHIRYK